MSSASSTRAADFPTSTTRQIPGGSDPAVNIPGFAYFGREPYSYIQRVEQRYQFTDNFSWTIGRHNMKFGGDFNYLPLTATFTVNYGGVYDFGAFSAASLGFCESRLPAALPDFPISVASAVLWRWASRRFHSGHRQSHRLVQEHSHWSVLAGFLARESNLTLNYGVRYDVEIPPKFAAPQGSGSSRLQPARIAERAFRPTRTIFSLASAWPGIPRETARRVVRASYGMFYDHPLLGLYFLGDASDGSSSGQLAFAGTSVCSGAGNPGNLNAITIFQGLPINQPSPANPCAATLNPGTATALGFLPNQQQFQAQNFPQIDLSQPELSEPVDVPAAGFQPFGYPQSKNFVYAYSQQANLTLERDLGDGFALSLAYNFNGGRHLNRPINANTIRGDLMVANFNAAADASTR